MLYELLAGAPPFRGASAMEVIRKVLNEEPVPPGLRRKQLAHGDRTPVDRDLETIVLKCLEKNPARRYGSAEALAEELERWQRGEPIRARPLSTAERVHKWIRRNPLPAASLAGVILATLVGIVGITWQWREAVRARNKAEVADNERRGQLWTSLGQQGHFSRHSGQLGQRTNALAAIARAARMQPSLPLRNDTLAALMLPDIGTQVWWRAEQSYQHPICYDPSLEFYLPHLEFKPGTTVQLQVRRSGDHRPVASLGEIERQISTARFSPDGRWLAAQFSEGELRVWEWRAGRLAGRGHCACSTWGHRSFDFSPDSRVLYYNDTNLGITQLDLDTGVVHQGAPAGISGLIRVAPAGDRLLATRGNEVQVWEIVPRRRLSITNFPDLPVYGIQGAAWHLNGEVVILGGQAGLYEWRWRDGAKRLYDSSLGANLWEVMLNRAGDLVVAAGRIWEVGTQQRVLTVDAQRGHIVALSEDGRRVAMSVQGRGFGVWEFLPPVGKRELIDNPRPGWAIRRLDVSPDGRLVLSAHLDGWRLWNARDGRIVGRGPSRDCFDVRFAADEHSFLSAEDDGLHRWSLDDSIADPPDPRRRTGTSRGQLTELPLVSPPDRSPILAAQISRIISSGRVPILTGRITPGGRFAVLVGNRHAAVTDLTRAQVFPPIRLAHPSDFEFALSTDGRWLVTGLHNRPDQDIWEVATGKHAGSIPAPTHPSCQFDPGSGQLVSWNPSEVMYYAPGTWRSDRKFSWPGTLAPQLLPGSIEPDGRTLWTLESDQQFSQVDAGSGAAFARLETPGGTKAAGIGFTASGTDAYVGTSGNTIRHFDLTALRRELARLGLDWPDTGPRQSFAPRRP